MVRKLYLSPSQASYSVTVGNDVVRTELDGGAGRYRRDVLNATKQISVSWLLDEGEYQYINAFYRTAIAEGSQAFYIDLLLDNSFLQQFSAYFMPGSFKLDSVNGYAYSVSATLEVIPLVVNDALNEAIIMLYEEKAKNNVNYSGVILALETLTNIQLPASLT